MVPDGWWLRGRAGWLCRGLAGLFLRTGVQCLCVVCVEVWVLCLIHKEVWLEE